MKGYDSEVIALLSKEYGKEQAEKMLSMFETMRQNWNDALMEYLKEMVELGLNEEQCNIVLKMYISILRDKNMGVSE